MPLTTNEKEYSKNSFKKGKYYRSKIYCQRNTGILIVHKQLKIFHVIICMFKTFHFRSDKWNVFSVFLFKKNAKRFILIFFFTFDDKCSMSPQCMIKKLRI